MTRWLLMRLGLINMERVVKIDYDDLIIVIKEEDDMENKSLIEKDISHELWREYEWLVDTNDHSLGTTTYRIENPVKLFFYKGSTTHRVVDKDGISHCIPSVGEKGCILRWYNGEDKIPVNF